MIGGLQGEFGDLDNKYLKQNIPKYLKNVGWKYQKALGEHCCTVYWEKNSADERYQGIRICLSGEVEASSSPIRLWNIRM